MPTGVGPPSLINSTKLSDCTASAMEKSMHRVWRLQKLGLDGGLLSYDMIDTSRDTHEGTVCRIVPP